jgi:hypothetical protein
VDKGQHAPAHMYFSNLKRKFIDTYDNFKWSIYRASGIHELSYPVLQADQSMAKKPEDFHYAISKQETDVGKEAPEVPSVFPGVISSDQGCEERGVEQSSLDPLLD